MARLFSRYLPRIRRIVALRTGRRLRTLHGEDDLVQQALLRVFRSLKDFEQRSEASFRNWVARCVENELVDLSRQAAAAKRRGGPIHLSGDPEAFLASVAADGNARHVCSISNLYLLRSLLPEADIELLRYDVALDPQQTVTFASALLR